MNAKDRNGIAPSLWWLIILGGAGFAVGFFGPIVFVPDANQGPLVGIFITGPLGVVLGLGFWILSRILDLSARLQWRLLIGSSTVLVLTTLFFIQPEPERRGALVELSVVQCQAPGAVYEETIKYWDKKIAAVTWASPRPGWRDDMQQALGKDRGVVIDTTVVRRNQIREHKTFWNRGEIAATGWQNVNQPKSYYIRAHDKQCAQYPAGTRLSFYEPYDLSAISDKDRAWPPRAPVEFIPRSTLAQIPTMYQGL
jgi:hypothetical protein